MADHCTRGRDNLGFCPRRSGRRTRGTIVRLLRARAFRLGWCRRVMVTRQAMAETFRNLIGGEWVQSSTGRTFETRNPADTDEVIGTYPRSDAADTRQAIEAARRAQPAWAAIPAPKRGEILHRASNILESR